jgi:hypothetical protein
MTTQQTPDPIGKPGISAPEVGLPPAPGTDIVGNPGVSQPPGNAYAYKNPLLYAFGGLFFAPLVLFLMGGSRSTCGWILGLWALFWLTVWLYGLGFIFFIAIDIWSVMACYQEAVKQNQAHGFAQ